MQTHAKETAEQLCLCAKSTFMRQGHHMIPKILKQHQHMFW